MLLDLSKNIAFYIVSTSAANGATLFNRVFICAIVKKLRNSLKNSGFHDTCKPYVLVLPTRFKEMIISLFTQIICSVVDTHLRTVTWLWKQLSSYHFYIVFVHCFNVGHEVTLVCERHFTSSALKGFNACVFVHVALQILSVCKTLFTDRALVSINSLVSIFVPV